MNSKLADETDLSYQQRGVLQALSGIEDIKAPGHDGFNALLFKKTWSIIGEQIKMQYRSFSEDRNFTNCGLYKCETRIKSKEIQPM